MHLYLYAPNSHIFFLAIIENITHRGHLKFPDEEDLSGAASALMRLQDTYLLDTATLARGHIEGTAPSPELTSTYIVLFYVFLKTECI